MHYEVILFILWLNQQPSRNVRRTLWEKYKKFFQSRFFCLFLELCKCLLRYKKFSKLGSRKFHFLKYKNIYHFPSSKSSVSWNINNFFVASLSWNIRKAFFWDNIRNFFEISASWYIRTVSFWENIRNLLISECKKVSWGGFFV